MNDIVNEFLNVVSLEYNVLLHQWSYHKLLPIKGNVALSGGTHL